MLNGKCAWAYTWKEGHRFLKLWSNETFRTLSALLKLKLWIVETPTSWDVVVSPRSSPALLTQSCPTLWLQGLQPTRLFCPWNFPGKNTGVGCHFLLQGIFLTQGLNLGLPHCRSRQGLPNDSLFSKVSDKYIFTWSDSKHWKQPSRSRIIFFSSSLTSSCPDVYLFNPCSVAKLCLTLCDPMDCSLPGSSDHGIFQAKVLEWVAISSSRGPSQPRDRTCVS